MKSAEEEEASNNYKGKFEPPNFERKMVERKKRKLGHINLI